MFSFAIVAAIYIYFCRRRRKRIDRELKMKKMKEQEAALKDMGITAVPKKAATDEERAKKL